MFFWRGRSSIFWQGVLQVSTLIGCATYCLPYCHSVASGHLLNLPKRAPHEGTGWLACVIQWLARLCHVLSLLLRMETVLATNATSERTALKTMTLAVAGKPSLASNHCQSLSSKTFCLCWIALPARWRAPGNVPAPTDTSTNGFETSFHPVARKGHGRPDSAQLEVFLLQEERAPGTHTAPWLRWTQNVANWMLQLLPWQGGDGDGVGLPRRVQLSSSTGKFAA